MCIQRQVNGRKVLREIGGTFVGNSTKIRPHKFSKYWNPAQGVYIRKSKQTMPGGYMREAVRFKKLDIIRQARDEMPKGKSLKYGPPDQACLRQTTYPSSKLPLSPLSLCRHAKSCVARLEESTRHCICSHFWSQILCPHLIQSYPPECTLSLRLAFGGRQLLQVLLFKRDYTPENQTCLTLQAV